MNHRFRFLLTNYVGQLRPYSLVDLVLLLWAARLTPWQMTSAGLLWLGFLVFLESEHRHYGREPFPKGLHYWLLAAGILCSFTPQACLFVLAGCLYTIKSNPKLRFGLFSPFLRGIQTYMLVTIGGEWWSELGLIAAIVIVLRNIAGDWRDVRKDYSAGYTTWPVRLGWPQLEWPIHQYAMVVTAVLWCILGDIAWYGAAAAVILIWVTYDWTPR